MKTVLAALSLLSAGVVARSIGQADNNNSRLTLAGLTGLYVSVELKTDDAQQNGLTEAQLRTDVELKLREAGIKVVAFEEISGTPGAPYLYVGVSALPLKSIPGVYAVSVNADLIQVIRLVRNPSTLALGRTWNATGVYGTLGASIVREEVRKRVRDLADQFINAYLAANPKR
jgi:hypothetical protein